MSNVINKENILKAFDNANGYGTEFGDWADYKEIGPVRDEFKRIIDELFKIEAKQSISCISGDALKLIDKELENEKSS